MPVRQGLLPLPCMVVVCRAGLLGNIPSAELRQKLDAPAGVDELVQLSEKFVSDVRAGRHAQEGWSNSMYGEHTQRRTQPADVHLLWQQQHLGKLCSGCTVQHCAQLASPSVAAAVPAR